MTLQIQNGLEARQDPDGSIFLPKDRFIKEFLELKGDPIRHLAELYEESPDQFETIYETLRLKLYLGRGLGVDLVGADEEECDKIFEQTVRFFRALCIASGRPLN